jgi:D-psicose/D-tagatose/L-ribulose 3-epimerase
MRISLCNEVIAAAMPFERQCIFARSLGYDGIEIAPVTLTDDPTALTGAQVAAWRRAAADAGLPITSLHYLLRAPAGLSITTADAAVRGRTVDVMRALCALAADLGARVLVHGSPDQRALTPGDEDDCRKRGVECFAAVAEAAAQAQVTYCIEPLSRPQTGFVNTVEEAAAIVRAIGSPAVRTMIDCSSAGATEAEPVAELVRRWVPTGLIGHVHFNDPTRRGPGEGAMQFAPILAALQATGYAGNSAVEPFIYQPDGPACAARAIGYLRGLLEAQAS